MTTGLAFWILMLLWLVLGFACARWPYLMPVNQLFLFILLLLVGWHVFGAPLKG